MKRTVLWIIACGVVFAAGFLGGFLYLDARLDAQEKEHAAWELQLQEALAPQREILYTSLTYEQVKQGAAAGSLSCVGSYPFLYLDTSGDPAQFIMSAGGSENIILLEKGVDVFPDLLQTRAQYTVCRDPNNGNRVVWFHPADFNGVKRIKRDTMP